MKTTQKIQKLFLTTAISAVMSMAMTPAQAQQAAPTVKQTTLAEALSNGVATNPEYGAVEASRKATQEELNQGRAGYLPSVDVDGDMGFEHSDDVGTRARGGDGEEDLFRKQGGLTLTQMLFDGWGTHYEVERQKARVASSDKRVKETSEFVGLSIVEAYLDVLRQRQLLMIARQNVAEHGNIINQILDGVQAGRSTQADSEQARARHAVAKANEASTAQALKDAETEYRRTVGDFAGELQLPKMPMEMLEADVDTQVEKTFQESPTLGIRASDIEVSKAESEATKASFYPQVDLQVNGRTGHDLGGVEGRDTSAAALVVMNWNLYRGGADTARTREFVHRHEQTKETYKDTARQVEADVRQTWASMIAAGERAKQFATQASANEQVVRAYKDQFNLDRRTLLDVLDSQNELFVSRSSTVNAEFLEMFAVYRLLALRGSLLPAYGVQYPAQQVAAVSEVSEETPSQE